MGLIGPLVIRSTVARSPVNLRGRNTVGNGTEENGGYGGEGEGRAEHPALP